MAPRPFETMEWLFQAPPDLRGKWLGEVLESMRPAFERRVRSFLVGTSLARRMDLADLVQDTYVRIVGGVERFRGRTWGEWTTWCRTIALNTALDAARRHHSDVLLDQPSGGDDSVPVPPDPPAPGRSPSSIVRGEERDQQVQLMLATLTPADRDLIRWRDFEGASWPRIAARLGCDEDAARMRHKRALVRFATVVEFLRDEA